MAADSSDVDLGLIFVAGPAMEPLAFSLQEPVSMGRASGSDIVLNDSSVSREHALLEMSDKGILVRDLDSQGGVYLNRVRIESGQQELLSNRDLLTIGPWSMLVRISEQAAVEPSLEETEMPADPEAGKGDSARDDSMYATHASIFIRLRADRTLDREIGWNEFAEKYSRVIAGFARNAGLRAQDADDVLQDVLMGFFRVSADFNYDPKKGRFRGYLKRVTLNAIRSRHRRRRPEVNIDESWEPPSLDESTDAIWDRQWTEQLLSRAMDQVRPKVEPRTWLAFELYGMRGVAIDAVADETGMTPEAIRHAKMRITKQVRAIVNEIREQEG